MSIPIHATALPSALIAALLPLISRPSLLWSSSRRGHSAAPPGTASGVEPSELAVWLTSVVVSASRFRTAT
jgi:hypothetical protein